MSKLPVLMYHNVNPNLSKGLTISIDKLESQINYLVKKKYSFFFVSELLDVQSLPSKSIVLTFDDVTQNQLIYALPILEKYQVKATFFIPFNYIGQEDSWNIKEGHINQKIMTVEQLKYINENIVEFGKHSFFHNRFSKLTINQIKEDFEKSDAFIKLNKITVFNSMAYPYGDYPKKGKEKELFFKILEDNNIKIAFRIGNRINSFPFKSKYEMQRIDVKGEDSLFRFKLKLRFGRLKLF